MKRTLGIFFSFLFLAAVAGAAERPQLKAGVFEPPRMAPDFSLQGSDGTQFKLSRYRGKVVALGFGYTSCPDVCPTTLAELASAKKKLGADGNELQVIYVTVDPERDTVETLHRYMAAFDPSFLGATGTDQQLAAVRSAYGISATKKMFADGEGYAMHHSSLIYLIDREGKLRALSPYGRTVDDVVHDVRILLKK